MAIREGTKTDIYPAVHRNQYGQLIMGLGSDKIARFINLDETGAIYVNSSSTPATKTSINIFTGSLLSPGVTLNLSSFTVPSGKTFFWTGGRIGGEAEGEFHFEADGSDYTIARNSGAEKDRTILFPETIQITENKIINIKVKSLSVNTKQYETLLSGYYY